MQRISLMPGFWLCGLIVVLSIPSAAPAQFGGGRGGARGGAGGGGQNQQAQQQLQQIQQALQQISQQLQQADKPLKEAREKAEDAQKEFQKVDQEHKANMRELAQAKKQAEEEAKNSPDLKAAREKADGLRKELAELRKQVIGELKKDNEAYATALKNHEDALAEQKAKSGANVSQDMRRTLAKKVAEADKAVKTIEDVAMTDNADANAIKERMKEAEAEVAVAAKAAHDMVENDPRSNSAKIAFLRTRDESKAAKLNFDRANGELARMQATIQALINQRTQLTAQQQLAQRMQQGGGQGQGGGRGYGTPRR